ncbi:unnamed protein product [Pleuronectes platessa]|uniref:Uncharacterized protein n=1 Tax=Pleuronectes platessa TaxID=8262 RepID=A0A9N7V2I9_PLEPL|nr:unnamed protein product [Pleuronectes platessa]
MHQDPSLQHSHYDDNKLESTHGGLMFPTMISCVHCVQQRLPTFLTLSTTEELFPNAAVHSHFPGDPGAEDDEALCTFQPGRMRHEETGLLSNHLTHVVQSLLLLSDADIEAETFSLGSHRAAFTQEPVALDDIMSHGGRCVHSDSDCEILP